MNSTEDQTKPSSTRVVGKKARERAPRPPQKRDRSRCNRDNKRPILSISAPREFWIAVGLYGDAKGMTRSAAVVTLVERAMNQESQRSQPVNDDAPPPASWLARLTGR